MAAEKGHIIVERGDKTSYEIEKAIIQEVAEKSNTQNNNNSISQIDMRENKLSNRTKKKDGQSMVTNWRICEKQRR